MSEDYRYSTLTLYKDCQIIPGRNFVIENIAAYLNAISSSAITIAQFQYLRLALDMNIKIHKEESFTAALAANNFNYLKVVQDSRTYYFFILKKIQRAEETIELELRMDVINTFAKGTDFNLTSRTKVLREHKDRFVNVVKNIVITGKTGNYNTWTPQADDTIYFRAGSVAYYGIVHDITIDAENNVTLEVTLDKEVSIYDLDQRYNVNSNILYASEDEETYVSARFTIINPARISFSDIKTRRIIDLYSEGLTPILYKEEKGELNDEDYNTWYLIYETNADATEDDPQPVNVYLAPKMACEIIDTTTITLTSASLESGKYYHFVRRFNENSPEVKAKFTGGSVAFQTFNAWNLQESYGFIIYRDPNNAGKICIEYRDWCYAPVSQDYYAVLKGTWDNLDEIIIESSVYPLIGYEMNSKQSSIKLILNGTEKSFNTTSTASSLYSFDTLDRTDSKLVKVIELPYLPVQTNIDANERLIFGSEWSVDGTKHFMKLNNNYVQFLNEIETSIESPYIPLNGLEESFIPDDNTFTLRWLKDPKLFHSDFYQPKFIYDSFGFVFQLEKMNQDKDYSSTFDFKFVMTTTIRSRFLFMFDDYELKYATEDYEKILSVARNNEAVLYNSPYLTYLRTGYNIDVKAKERTELTAVLGGIISGVGAIAGVGLGVSAGNEALSKGHILSGQRGIASTIISGASSLAGSIINTINTIASAEENMEKKLNTLKAQAVSVEGSDDLDLLNAYSNNKAKYAIYKVSPRLDKELDNLFYYTGYISNEMKIPDTNTRRFFNFLSADIDITGVSSNISDLCLSEIKRLYLEGIYFIHDATYIYNGVTYHSWDTQLQRENFEISIMNHGG